MISFILLFSSVLTNAWAQEHQVSGFKGGSAQDLLHVTKIPAHLQTEPSKLKMESECKSSTGSKFKKGDAGFDACMNEVNKRQNQFMNPAVPGAPGLPGAPNEAQSGITIQTH